MNIDELLQLAPRKPQPAPVGQIRFRTDRPPTKRAMEAAMSQPVPDCVGMIEGGICEHGVNAHRAFGRQQTPMKMCASMRDNLAAMTEQQQQAKLDLAGQILTEQILATIPQAQPGEVADALQDLATAIYATAPAPETETT